jgi:predicted AlkP superfamily phosphohydrolase/phosphomutase
MARVAAIAIDAAERWYVEQLLAQGKLPNLAALRARGVWAELETPKPYRSEVVWARFLTGDEPLETKDWATCSTFDPATYRQASNPASGKTPFFALGDEATVVALDLIHSRPADGVRGSQVVAWGCHSPQWPRSSSPAGLLTEIDRRFGINPAFENEFAFGWHTPDFLRELGEACLVGVRRRVDIAEWLITDRQPDWDLFLTCLSELHIVGHQMWHGVDPSHPLHGVATSDVAGALVERTMVAMDEAIGRLVQAAGDDTAVVVFALHGQEPADDIVSTILLPELLARRYLGRAFLASPGQAAWRAAGCPPLVPEPGAYIGDVPLYAFADTLPQRLRRFGHRLLPQSLWERARRLAGRPDRLPIAVLPDRTGPEVLEVDEATFEAYCEPTTYQPAAWYRRHWHEMRAFAMPSFADGHIRINLEGREANGVVAAGDYEAAMAEVEELLRACRDPRTGESIVSELIRLRAGDPFDPDGPDADMLVVFQGGSDAIEHPDLGTIGPFPQERMSIHSSEGWALVAGPGLAPGELGRHPSRALTPTILELLGKTPPATSPPSLLAGHPSRP